MSRDFSLFVMIPVTTLVLVNVGRAQFATVVNSPPTIIGDDQGFGSDTQLNVFDSGGIGISFSAGARDGSSENVQINISGGLVGDEFDANSRSTVTISGGSVGRAFDAFSGSTVTISGGLVGDGFDANSGSTVNISGGSVGDRFDAFNGSTVNLFGTEFLLNDVPVSGLNSPGDEVILDERNGQTLAVTLRDSGVVEFALLGTRFLDDYFSSDALLHLFLVEPFEACDLDRDDSCALSDIDAIVGEIVAGTNDSAFDLTSDGVVNNADLSQWLSTAATKNGFGAPYLPGDTNLDGSVDSADLNKLALSWSHGAALWSAGDFTADGNVNAADLNGLALNWQQSIPVAASRTTAIPEPAAATLAVFILAVVTCSARFLARRQTHSFYRENLWRRIRTQSRQR